MARYELYVLRFIFFQALFTSFLRFAASSSAFNSVEEPLRVWNSGVFLEEEIH